LFYSLVSTNTEYSMKFVTTFGPEMGVGYNVTYDDIHSLEPNYVGFNTVCTFQFYY
jgi:hypothetical protein